MKMRPTFTIVRVAVIALVAVAAAVVVRPAHNVGHQLHVSNLDAIQQADELAWNNRWLRAASLYRDVETKAQKDGNTPAATYAHVSQFITRAENEPVQPLLLEVQRDLASPAATAPDVRLRLLVIEGMLATNFDAALARRVWLEVEGEASAQHRYKLMMRAIGEKGIADFYLGDIRSAKKEVTHAWIAAKYLGDPAAQIRYSSVYGQGLVELHRYDEAIHVLDAAIKIANAHPEIAYPSIAYNAKVDALRGLHRNQDAIALAKDYTSHLPSDPLQSHLFQLHLSAGNIYEDMGDRGAADKEYAEALNYAHQAGFWRGIIQAGGVLARAQLHSGDLDDALKTIDDAIAANTQLPQELYYLPKNLSIKASILKAMRKDKASDELYGRSLRIAEILLSTATTPNVKRELIADLEQIYTGYFESLAVRRNFATAFQVIESVRGRIEEEALQSQDKDPLQPSRAEIQLASLNVTLAQAPDMSERQQLDSQLYEIEMELAPSGPLVPFRHAPVPLSSIEKSLKERDVVLEYVLDDPHSFVMAITSSGTRVYTLNGRQQLRDQILRYRRLIASKQASSEDASQLFTELLGGVKEYSTSLHVVVIPDQELHLLPFATLMCGGQYLAATHEISVSPSATVLYLLRESLTTGPDTHHFLGVAPWTNDDEWAFSPLRVGSSPPVPLMKLPASQTEVENAAKDSGIPATVLLGPDATETKFKHLDLSQFAVLHLALHGYADDVYPDRSALIFAPQPKGPDDGLLTVREVRSLRLTSRLVTLSACDTGEGPFSEADVANMANAFIEAGSRSVISALWGVDDAATARLMKDLYTELGGGQSASSALRRSQMLLIQEGLPPYYWGAFEVSGDGSINL